ncbi:MAG: hypothetical protein LC720_06235, partial [Actinobacteria bacterium]|nr:hypothetical protein [Actinomycetota bacterium]
MTAATLLWIALPGGTRQGGAGPVARLSVLLSPRLTAAGAPPPPGALTLADFPALRSWPDQAQRGAVSFAVQVDGGPSLPATIISPPPDRALWASLLPPTTTVEPHAFDRDGLGERPISSYSQSRVMRHLQDGYAGVYGSSPVGLPGRRRVLPAFPRLAAALAPSSPNVAPAAPQPARMPTADASPERRESELAAVHTALSGDLLRRAAAGDAEGAVAEAAAVAAALAATRPRGTFTPLLPATENPASEFARLLAFHHRPAAPSSKRAGVTPALAAHPPPGDFHGALTLLRDHPLLLRRLGLVIDLELALSGLPQSPVGHTGAPRLRVVPTFAAALPGVTVTSPWTAFNRQGDRLFAAAPANVASAEISAGMLNLSLAGAFDLLQVDADGAALKTVNLLVNQQGSGGAAGSGDDLSLPALRGTGIALVRNENDRVLAARIAAADANQAALSAGRAGDVTMYAEDLTRGYRIDVHDLTAGGPWRSLHRRAGTYVVSDPRNAPLTLAVADEGVAIPATTHDPAADPRSPLRIHETLARWEGYSLSVPRPGKAIGDQGATDVPSVPQPGGLQVQSTFHVPDGSLPRLRYGRRYQIRARAVDLGGHSLAAEEVDDTLASVG